MPPHVRRSLLDRLGATGSLLCAVHCALVPLLIALAPTLGAAGWLDGGFEFGFVLFATGLGLYSLVTGYRRHGEVRALWLLIPGLVALWLAILFRPLHEATLPHALAMTVGGALVGLAHLANLRLNHGATDRCCASADPKIS